MELSMVPALYSLNEHTMPPSERMVESEYNGMRFKRGMQQIMKQLTAKIQIKILDGSTINN